MESIKRVDKDGIIRYTNEKGQYHRIDGPASISYIGIKSWYINGKRHREDGPAVEYPTGDVSYYLNGLWYSVEEWEEEIIKLKLGRIKDL